MSIAQSETEVFVGFRIDDSLKKELQLRAVMKRVTLSEILREILTDFLESEEKKVSMTT